MILAACGLLALVVLACFVVVELTDGDNSLPSPDDSDD